MPIANRVALALAPQTGAYHSIWIDGVQLDLENRRTKISRTRFTAKRICRANSRSLRHSAGERPGHFHELPRPHRHRRKRPARRLQPRRRRRHGPQPRQRSQTYPRLADVIGFFTPDKLVDVAKAVLTIHRDFGDRTDRKHARLKYVVAERGVDWTRAEIEKRAGITLEPARPFKFTSTGDLLRLAQGRGRKMVSRLFVETGRVKDAGERRLKTALRQVAEKFPNIEFRLSANQNVILANVAETDKAAINALLAEHGVKTENQASVLHAASMACPPCPPAASRSPNPNACCPA
jgi:sulfite reductase (NADPH) hemoprotein beta-component